MKMSPGVRRLALMVHVIASVGLLGTIAGFLALAIVGLAAKEEVIVGGVYVAMNIVTLTVIVPLTFAALLTGIIQSLGTPWGLFEHYWVIFKLVLTAAAASILMLQLPSIGLVAELAARESLIGQEAEARLSFVLHASGGLFVLLLVMILSVYKPKGRTRLTQ